MQLIVKLADGSEKEIEIRDNLPVRERNAIRDRMFEFGKNGDLLPRTTPSGMSDMVVRAALADKDFPIDNLMATSYDEIFAHFQGIFGMEGKKNLNEIAKSTELSTLVKPRIQE
jgi:hypothetical protein